MTQVRKEEIFSGAELYQDLPRVPQSCQIFDAEKSTTDNNVPTAARLQNNILPCGLPQSVPMGGDINHHSRGVSSWITIACWLSYG